MNLYDISVFLREHNNYEILTHNYPDGDTLGSGYALCIALQQLGKNARVITAKLPPKFEYLTEGVEEQDFTADYIISTDVAADSLLAPNMENISVKLTFVLTTTVQTPLPQKKSLSISMRRQTVRLSTNFLCVWA